MLFLFKESIIMATERQIYWQGIIDKHVANGLTKAEFFKHNNINPATLRCRKLNKNGCLKHEI